MRIPLRDPRAGHILVIVLGVVVLLAVILTLAGK